MMVAPNKKVAKQPEGNSLHSASKKDLANILLF
jgi:hypothetical protein